MFQDCISNFNLYWAGFLVVIILVIGYISIGTATVSWKKITNAVGFTQPSPDEIEIHNLVKEINTV